MAAVLAGAPKPEQRIAELCVDDFAAISDECRERHGGRGVPRFALRAQRSACRIGSCRCRDVAEADGGNDEHRPGPAERARGAAAGGRQIVEKGAHQEVLLRHPLPREAAAVIHSATGRLNGTSSGPLSGFRRFCPQTARFRRFADYPKIAGKNLGRRARRPQLIRHVMLRKAAMKPLLERP